MVEIRRIASALGYFGSNSFVHISDKTNSCLRSVGNYSLYGDIDSNHGKGGFERLLHRTNCDALQAFRFDTPTLGMFGFDKDHFVHPYFHQLLQHPLHPLTLFGGGNSNGNPISPRFLPGLLSANTYITALAIGSFYDGIEERTSPIGQTETIACLHTQDAQDMAGFVVRQSVGLLYIGRIE